MLFPHVPAVEAPRTLLARGASHRIAVEP
jgi:hypothetical protein